LFQLILADSNEHFSRSSKALSFTCASGIKKQIQIQFCSKKLQFKLTSSDAESDFNNFIRGG
jgi:hypothetical protein